MDINMLMMMMMMMSHHQAIVYLWEFEASFDGWMLFLMPTHYGLRKRCKELKTSLVVVEILPSPRTLVM